MKEQKLVLASASPRRRELMSMFGFPYTCQSADIDEHVHTGETAQVYVQRLAREKNDAVQADTLILSADTVVAYNGSLMGKPDDAQAAADRLMELRGKDHTVLTALHLREDGHAWAACCETRLRMRQYTRAEMDAYIASGDYRDKAGGYAIQHQAFHPVESLEGCYANVLGLPLCHLFCLLRQAGLQFDADIPSRCQQHLGITCEVYPGILARCNAENWAVV